MHPHVNDEMGVYLRKIGKTPLLSREEELAVAENVCRTRRKFLGRLLANDYSLRVVLAAAWRAAGRRLRIDFVLQVPGIDTASRRAAHHRLSEGIEVLQKTLRRNRRDLRIARDGTRDADERMAARRSVRRRRRRAAVRLQKLQFQGFLLRRPLTGLTRIVARMEELSIGLRDTRSQSARGDGRREVRSELRRLVRLAGETPRRLGRLLDEIRSLERAHRAACHAFMAPNLRLVVALAKQFASNSDELLDLIQEGNLGLMKAIDKFEPERGNRFSTYAYWWIRQTIRRALAQQRHGFHTSYVMARKFDKIETARRVFQQKHRSEPSTEEIAASAKLAPAEVERLLLVHRPPTSIESGRPADRPRLLAETVSESRQPAFLEKLDQESLERRVDEILGALDMRERQVLRMRFGLLGQQPLSLSDIGKVLHVSKERVRQIEEEAMAKLRRPGQASRLVQFFQDSPERLMRAAADLNRCKDDLVQKKQRRLARQRV